MSRCRECHYGYHALCERPDCECRCLPNMHNRKIDQEAEKRALLAEEARADLRHVTFECGHSRTLWFFPDEPPLTHAMCLGESCPTLAMREIVNVGDRAPI